MDLVNYTRANAGKPGHNEYGVPLHACNGYRQDEHYWAWIRYQREALSKYFGTNMNHELEVKTTIIGGRYIQQEVFGPGTDWKTMAKDLLSVLRC